MDTGGSLSLIGCRFLRTETVTHVSLANTMAKGLVLGCLVPSSSTSVQVSSPGLPNFVVADNL